MRKLTESVSIQELQQMRDEGLSNSEIAKRLDVSYHCILKYLGVNPNRKPVERKKATEYSGAGLLPSGKDEYFVGSQKKRFCLHNRKVLDIFQMQEDGGRPLFTGLKKDDVESLIVELRSAHRMMEGA